MFNIGDWVKITPTPDLKWDTWNNSRETYDKFAGRIGTIIQTANDPDRKGESLICIEVEFPNGLAKLSPGTYYEWFRPEHLIRSSKYEADLYIHRNQVANDLQEWENFKKKSTNDILKSIFAPEEKSEDQKRDLNKQTDTNTTDEWDLKTNPGYKYRDDNYDYDPYDCIVNNSDDSKQYSFSYSTNCKSNDDD